jgi:hypothetical protein
MKEMRTDALLRFAQLVSLVPIFTGKWRIECASARKAAFVDEALRRIIGRLIMQFYESWNFGWQAEVKQFGLMSPSWTFIDREAEGGAAAGRSGTAGPASRHWCGSPSCRCARSPSRRCGLPAAPSTGSRSPPRAPRAPTPSRPCRSRQTTSSTLRPASARSSPTTTSAARSTSDHSLWVVNERDSQFGSIWGRSRLSYAYKYWYSYEMTLGILNRSVERKGDPTIIVTFPQGSSRINNQDVPNQTIAFDIGNKARSGSVLVVPSEVWGEDTGTSNQSPKWGITYLKAEETFDKLIAVLSYLDTMKIRSMMISELSAFEGSGGTSSRNVAAVTGERSYEAQIFTQTEWDEIINRYMIPQLADANFPELKDEPARKVTQAFGQDEAALAADILRSVANANSTNLPIDLPALLERFQIDALSGDDLAKWERRSGHEGRDLDAAARTGLAQRRRGHHRHRLLLRRAEPHRALHRRRAAGQPARHQALLRPRRARPDARGAQGLVRPAHGAVRTTSPTTSPTSTSPTTRRARRRSSAPGATPRPRRRPPSRSSPRR